MPSVLSLCWADHVKCLNLKDVLFVDSGDPWNPQPATVEKVMAMLEGVHRILKQGGTFISISFGQVSGLIYTFVSSSFLFFFPVCSIKKLSLHSLQPHFRRPLFEAPAFTWSFEWNTFGDGFHYFFYTLKKVRRNSLNNFFSSIYFLYSNLHYHLKKKKHYLEEICAVCCWYYTLDQLL